MLIAVRASADWVKSSENDIAVFYIDHSTISRENGNLRRAWELQDLKARGPNGEQSRRVLTEYHCQEERWRMIAVACHSGQMATGKTLVDGRISGAWEDAPHDTPAEYALKLICSR